MREVLAGALEEAQDLLDALQSDEDAMDALAQSAEIVRGVFEAGGSVLACGNGGSLADAMHFCEEWTGRFRSDRDPYPAISLCDPTHITCVANDYGFEHVFARQVRAIGRPGDALLILSTSGESENLLLAAREAQALGVTVIGLLGRGGGAARALCDCAVVVPGNTPDRIQELHMLCLHAIIEAVEGALAETS